MNLKKISRGLGWFSVALGIAEVVAPKQLTHALGVDEHDKLVRGFGLRELGPGMALLRAAKKSPWLWARVAGDAIDLAALGSAFKRSSRRIAVGAAVAAVAGIGVIDAWSAYRASHASAA
jgi:hypothetical protein